MIKQYFKIALKKILNDKKTSFMNILGLGLGIASTLIIIMWIEDERSYDDFFKNSERISQAYLKGIQPDDISYQATTSPSIAGRLKAEYPEIEETARLARIDELAVRYKDKIFLESMGGAADASYLSIFNYDFLYGSPDKVLREPNSILITESMAKKYFGQINPLNKNLTINTKYVFNVDGVIRNLPKNAYRKFDFLIPFEFIQNLGYPINGEDFYPCSYLNYALLHENTNLDALREKVENDIQTNVDGKIEFRISLQALSNTYLLDTGSKTKLPLFAALALFILILACINYTNLTLGHIENHKRGYGIQQVNGAKKIHIFSQRVFQSLITTTLATTLALIVVHFFLNSFNEITGKSLNLQLTSISNLGQIIILITFVGILAGLYPALIIASKKPLTTIKNLETNNMRGYGFKTYLVIFQFVISVFFLITTIVFFRQNQFIDQYNYGFNKNNILYSGIAGEIVEKVPEVRAELLKYPDIVSVTASSHLPNGIFSGSFYDLGINTIESEWVSNIFVDENFLETFGIETIEGRFFKGEISSDRTNAVVINQSAASLLDDLNPVGKALNFRGQTYTIIGLIKDFQNTSPLSSKPHPLVLEYNQTQSNYLTIKLNPSLKNPEQLSRLRKSIEGTLNYFSPDRPLYTAYLTEYSYQREMFLKSSGQIMLLASILAILISCFGLFGIVYQNLSKRIKEIGIRRVNGAKPIEIMQMLNIKFLSWIIIAFGIACPLSYFILRILLDNFAQRIDLSWWIFFLGGIIVAALALLTISWQSYLAVRKNPVEALRYE